MYFHLYCVKCEIKPVSSGPYCHLLGKVSAMRSVHQNTFRNWAYKGLSSRTLGTRCISTFPGLETSLSHVALPPPTGIFSGCANSSLVPIYTHGWKEAL